MSRVAFLIVGAVSSLWFVAAAQGTTASGVTGCDCAIAYAAQQSVGPQAAPVALVVAAKACILGAAVEGGAYMIGNWQKPSLSALGEKLAWGCGTGVAALGLGVAASRVATAVKPILRGAASDIIRAGVTNLGKIRPIIERYSKQIEQVLRTLLKLK